MRLLILVLCVALAGCAVAPEGPQAQPPAPVTVSYPVEREVSEHADYTARTKAVDSVEVRAHVWGYLERTNFKEGDIVKQGAVLFEIDPRTYKAALGRAEGSLAQLDARVERLNADFARVRRTSADRTTSREEYDKIAGDRGEAIGSRAAAKAAVDQARLDLEYTKVIAPVGGRVGRYIVTRGNLIQAGDQNGGTLLTTIESVDPMYAYFDVDEYTALRVRKLIREGKSDSPREGGFPLALGLANEEGHPHKGTINFVDNRVNPKTGTIRLRGVFPNKDQVLLPGFFARVRVPIGRPHKALLVTDRALDTDQGQKILYLVNEKNEVVTRPVRIGPLHDGLREITDGLKASERVIVTGLQHVRPGMAVEPTVEAMPVQRAKVTR
jgi:RND family efflux transporter MFP subunit